MIRILFVLTLALAPLRAAEPEAAVIGIATIQVGPLLDRAEFREAKQNLETKSPRLRARALKEWGLPPEAIQRITMVMFKVVIDDQEMKLPPAMVIVPRKPVDVDAAIKATGLKPANGGKLSELPEFTLLADPNSHCLAISKGAIVQLPGLHSDELKKCAEVMIAKAVKRDADRAAVMEKEKAVAQFVLDIPELARGYQGDFDENGQPMGIPLALQSLLKARVGTVTVSLGEKLFVRGEVSFANADDAAAAKPSSELILKQLQRVLQEEDDTSKKKNDDKVHVELAQFAMTLLKDSTVTVKDKTLHLVSALSLPADIQHTASAAVILAENTAGRVTSQNNLKILALAGHNAAESTNGVPIENICDDKGKPLLSWRVRLLPYLEEQALYDQFKLDEPWDSQNNKKLIAKMPKVFAVETAKPVKEGETFYQTFLGKKGAAARPWLQDGEAKGLSFSSITDGTSNTMMIVEASEAVTWTKPDDVPFDPNGPVPKLGGHFAGGFNAALGDGSVRFIRDSVVGEVLKALITANGGETNGLED